MCWYIPLFLPGSVFGLDWCISVYTLLFSWKVSIPVSVEGVVVRWETRAAPPIPSPLSLSYQQMFVRLFVDENLDRMVPISKQPKEKIQAIIDSCRRQFPEYQERARKRIRTYLKSCRRMKRSGFEMVSFDVKSSPSETPYVISWHYFVFILVSLFLPPVQSDQNIILFFVILSSFLNFTPFDP